MAVKPTVGRGKSEEVAVVEDLLQRPEGHGRAEVPDHFLVETAEPNEQLAIYLQPRLVLVV